MIPLSIAGLVFGAIVTYAAMMLNSKPEKRETWGILIIIFSILSVVTGGGFGIGLVLGIIGGIMGMTWKEPYEVKPITYRVAEPSEISRFCVECGRQVSSDVKFCPHCGKEMPE